MRRLLPQATRSQRSPQLERGVGLSLVALLGPSRSVGYELGFRSEPSGGRAARAPIGVSLSRAREQCPWRFALLGCRSVLGNAAASLRNADHLSAPSWPHRGTWQDPCRSVPCTHSNRSSTSAHRELIDVRRWRGRRSFRTRDRLQVTLRS